LEDVMSDKTEDKIAALEREVAELKSAVKGAEPTDPRETEGGLLSGKTKCTK
jgi:hypothetical protein